MKKALVQDWYYVNGGAEKVVHSINNIWNDFDHYSLIDFLNDDDREFILKGKKAKTSFIQKLPTAKSNHRKFLQLFPYAIESFDLSEYDLIVSSSGFVAKGVLTHQNQTHICYCHSPMRYAWDLYHKNLNDSGLNKGLKSWYVKRVLHKLRIWDIASLNRVDHFVANSNHIARRIKKIYDRDAKVIYPPVDVNKFQLETVKDNYYITASRLVSHKKVNVIAQAFTQMKDKKLLIVGDGPEMSTIKSFATQNIEMLGHVTSEELKTLIQKAKAFVFAAEEDFGIAPVEAQACGTPVICLGKGGCAETIINNETGLFFDNQNVKEIIEAVKNFEAMEFDYEKIRKNALRFSMKRFEIEFQEFVESKV
ncbi:glycosyltransferase [Flavobacteriaceae bacterium S0825]|uniref:glycosyltransferase n=1 Tax=Gaetbulibacter sp. S0825 TaxID=2720084 RepID=UPI001430987A|nr:glycosyltransferase [Gaetbulibacter sp. S0825]MCK0108297.1 glycosyltransferase [Flavobacteriaceae bacterium S0825]NIX63933.1 glycosyltransferase family 4 protein [Gaetbulibacter sp. S0825]